MADGPPTIQLVNEFAAVRVSLDATGRGPRLLVEDLETAARVHLDPLELASFCLATDEQRRSWLAVGPYVPPDEADDDGADGTSP